MSCQNKAKPNKKTNTYFFSKSTTRLENSTHGFLIVMPRCHEESGDPHEFFSPQPRNDEAQAVIVESCLRKRCNPIGRACLGTAWESPVKVPDNDERVNRVLLSSLYCNVEVLPWIECLLHAHCLT